MIKYSEMTLEEKQARFQKLNVIDDAFFHKIIEDREVAEEIVRVLMNDYELELVEVTAQKFLRNIGSKSVILDSLCIDGNGNLINVEVQKSDNDDHVRRVRYNISNLDTMQVEKGTDYIDLPEVYVFYISKFDIFKLGRTVYNVKRIIDGTSIEVHNGVHEIYANTAVDDGSDLANMLQYFTNSNGVNEKLPKLSNRVNYFKVENKGVDDMCEFSEWLRNEGREEGIEVGREEAMLEVAKSLKEENADISMIEKVTGLSKEEIVLL